MTRLKKPDQKTLELKRTGTLNPRPDAVSDTLFKENPFFDPKDLLQVRYEMLRRHSVEGASIVEVASRFGVSRPTVYQAEAAFQQAGLGGLLPKHRGPKEGHKLSAEVIEYVRTLRAGEPALTTVACVQAVQEKFGIAVHRRSLERALAGKKNRGIPRKSIHPGGHSRSLRRTPPPCSPIERCGRTPGRPPRSRAPRLSSLGTDQARTRACSSTAIAFSIRGWSGRP
jgi:transposase